MVMDPYQTLDVSAVRCTLVDAHVQISEPAVRSLIKGYLDMRNMVGRGTKTISATPRQLESLIRLSEGLAKMRHARCARILPGIQFCFWVVLRQEPYADAAISLV